MLLHEIAHARAGDKGNISTLSVIAYDSSDFEFLCHEVTVPRVRSWLAGQLLGPVTRFELPRLSALHFVCSDALQGGVTTSLAADAHGKGLSSRLLAMPIPDRHAGQLDGPAG